MQHNELNVTWLPVGGKELALNPATGDWLLLDTEAKELFLAAAGGEEQEALRREFPTVSAETISNLCQSLEKMDFHSVEDCGNAHDCSDCHQGRFPRLAVLNLTEDCNLKCSYCYVGAGEGQKAQMKPETAFRIVDEYLAMNADAPDQKINIVMHGGEPLLNYELVEKLTEYVQPYRDRINLSIQTNATLLTEERVSFLLDRGVSIGISLDGPPEIHNQTRPMQSGQGSFDQVMRGIRLLQAHGLSVGVISVMTRKLAEQIDHVVDFFLENQIYTVSFSPFIQVGRGANDDDNFVTAEILFEAYKRLIDRIVAHNSRPDRPHDFGENILTRIARKIFSNLNDYMCTRAPCGSGRDILGFGINGDFYACDDFINDPNFWIGSLDRGSIKEQLLQTDVIRTRCNRSMAELPRCRSCVWRSLCGGICHSADYYSGAKGVEQTAMCGFYKKLIPYLIECYIRNPELPVLLGAEPKPQQRRTLFFALSREEDPEEELNGEDFAELLCFHDVQASDTVFFCGSEPTEQPKLPELLRAAAKLSAKLVLATNGFGFAEEAAARELLQAGPQNVLISVPEDPKGRKKLYRSLDCFFRVRSELKDQPCRLILRAKAPLVDKEMLPVLNQLRGGDQLIVIGTAPKKVSTKELSPLMRTMIKLHENNIVQHVPEDYGQQEEPKDSSIILNSGETKEKLIWIDSENYAGRELTKFPTELLYPAS